MNYIEMREIVDPIIDGAELVKPQDAGDLSAAVWYAKRQFESITEKIMRRDGRIEKLKDINCPDVILENERRVMSELCAKSDAIDDMYKMLMCLSKLSDECKSDALSAIDDSKRRGCRDCAYRLSDYKGGTGIDPHFYCGMYVGYTEQEKAELREKAYIEEGCGCVRELSKEETEEYIAKGRPIFDGARFNTPCDRYRPAETPLSSCMSCKKTIERMKELYAGKLPSKEELEDEGWDEESLLGHLVFCRINDNKMHAAEHKLLKAIFGEEKEESPEEASE